MWGEAMNLVVFVWNNIAVFQDPSLRGTYLSRAALLEGHKRAYDISNFRAFGTKCFWMLTLEKKGGRKDAVGAKAREGAIVGIEDNMPAYRVYDFTLRGARKIPFAQVVTHEGHFPFREKAQWTEEEKGMPDSFIPSLEARADANEWRKFRFSEEESKELEEHTYAFSPAPSSIHLSGGGLPPSTPPSSLATPIPEPMGGGGFPSPSRGTVLTPNDDDLSIMEDFVSMPHLEPLSGDAAQDFDEGSAGPAAPVPETTQFRDPVGGESSRPYNLRETKRIDYDPPRMLYKRPSDVAKSAVLAPTTTQNEADGSTKVPKALPNNSLSFPNDIIGLGRKSDGFPMVRLWCL
jgi:hypothetical protein